MRLLLMQPVWIPNLHDVVRWIWLQEGGTAAVADGGFSGLMFLMDHLAWSRKGRTHRALIRTPEGTTWLHLPVRKEDRDKAIREVRMDHTSDWVRPLFRTLEYNYRNSVYFDHYEQEIRADLEQAREFEYLVDVSNYMYGRLLAYLEFVPAFERMNAAELENRWKAKAESSSRVPEDPDVLANVLGADAYVQEWGSRHYMRQGSGVLEPVGLAPGQEKAMISEFRIPEYHQHFEGFEPDVCLLDLLFQMGPEAFLWMDKVREELRKQDLDDLVRG